MPAIINKVFDYLTFIIVDEKIYGIAQFTYYVNK